MNNARDILMQILAIIGSSRGTERLVDDFCTWIEAQVMTDLMKALPMDTQNQLIDKFLALPQHEKESVFYPYYTGEHMQERLKDATKTVKSSHQPSARLFLRFLIRSHAEKGIGEFEKRKKGYLRPFKERSGYACLTKTDRGGERY